MLLETVSTIKQVCIGVNRYSSARAQAMFINCLESYPEDEQNSIGQYQVSHRCSYEDFSHFEKNRPSFFNPMVVTAEGKFEMFAGDKVFTVTRIVSVEPYVAKKAAPVQAVKS